jgi:hypothetical protein
MSIKFACSCGKHLRVRDAMAGRRVMCPRCGAPAGVPSLQPTHVGTAANPMTPEERRLQARLRPPHPMPNEGIRTATPADSITGGTTLVTSAPNAAGKAAPRARPKRRREARWYHCLVYACRAWPLVFGLGLAWAVWAVWTVVLPPILFESAPDPARPWLAGGVWLLATLVLLGYTGAFLDCALTAAAAGEVAYVRWPGADLRLTVKSLGRWLLALLAGPAVFAGAGFSHWLHGGDLTFLDWLILAEVGVLAVAYWVLAVAAAAEHERFRDINPLAVARLGHRLGWGTLVILAAAALALAHGWLIVAALADLRRGLPGASISRHIISRALPPPPVPPTTFGGFVEAGIGLTLTCISAVFLATFLFRLLGMWCYRSQFLPTPEATASPALALDRRSSHP